jgi:peptide/nickel transport system permease protein
VRYLSRRLLRALLLLMGVSVLCFFFTEMAPGSFFDEMRLNPQVSPEAITTLRSHHGLDRPLPVRYAHWVRAVAHGDLGYSIAFNAPVTALIWARAKNTLLLTGTATLFTWLIGIPFGILTANSRGRMFDRAIGTATSLLVSVPEIVIATALLAIAVRWRVVPVGGLVSLEFDELSAWKKAQDLLRHMLLPVSILVLSGIGVVERHVRASILDVLDAPCIRAAQGLGIRRARLLFRHVLPMAANPAISLFGSFLAALLGGSLLAEVMSGWPGLGPLILDATFSRDLSLVIAAVMLSAVFMVAGNFLADLLLVASDPRIRAGGLDAQ